MNERILLIGCGEIGSRHLQAVASLTGVRAIEVFDTRPEGLALGRKRLDELTERPPDTEYRWLSTLKDATPGGDLCIVATQADVRCRVVHDVAETLGYRSFLIEKLVSRSVEDYQELLEFARTSGLSVWVNCKTRAHPSHMHVKERLDRNAAIVFAASSGNHGLVTNGIHMADLFAFYDEADRIESTGSQIDPVLHQTKRGAYDLSGTLSGRTGKGSTFMLSMSASHMSPGVLSVVSPHYRAVVDDAMKWIYESSEETGWAWRPVSFEANLLISNMTKTFVSDIFATGSCRLPTLQQCFAGHEYILREIGPHFRSALGTALSHSPVT